LLPVALAVLLLTTPWIAGAVFFAILFGLFCYSLELDRLGKAIEESAPTN
jgi:MFS superfamily sulfate permease-like transporter